MVVVAGGVDWLTLLTPPLLPPPPQAATAKAQTMLMPVEADARLGKMRWKFMMHSIKVKSADYPHEYRGIKNWLIAPWIFIKSLDGRCSRHEARLPRIISETRKHEACRAGLVTFNAGRGYLGTYT
jgi:hypothetical protein